MARFVLDIRTELSISIVMVEHDMRLVMDLADRVMVIDFGRRIALGTPEQVQRDPAVIAAYLGGASEQVVADVAEHLSLDADRIGQDGPTRRPE